MKLGIVIYSDDKETVQNGFRFANFALKNKNTVKVFLLAKGVEYESLDSEQFDIIKQAHYFMKNGGIIFACGTCVKLRKFKNSKMCPMSTMEDLYNIVLESDKILSF